MQIENLPIEIHLTIEAETPKVLVSRNLDFDLLKIKLKRLLETHGGGIKICLDTLKIDSANIRSSLYIKTLGDLVGFLDGLEIYVNRTKSKNVLQSVSEYVGCFDKLYHKVLATDVLSVIDDIVVASFHRSEKPKDLDKSLPPPVEVATNWMVSMRD